MELELKPDWEECRARIDAWWRAEVLDRVPIKVTAPLWKVESEEPDPEDLEAHWTDPDRVIPRLERHVEATYWGGEAAPVMFPVSTGLVAILAAYLGCPIRFLGTRTVWVEPILDDWDDPPPLEFDPENEWWRRSAALLGAAARRAPGRYLVGLPDLNGPGEILARLRGTERLCIDVLESPGRIPPALENINLAWYRYFEACTGIIHQRLPGSISWMGIWSLIPSIDLQCDFSCMISPAQFDELFLPAVRQQTEWVARTIYHLDGPGAVGHLDSLLALPELTGIQWVAGAGAPPMAEWTDLCRRVLEAGKLLYIDCEPEEVETLLEELPHKGLLLQTRCATKRDAEQLLADMRRWSG